MAGLFFLGVAIVKGRVRSQHHFYLGPLEEFFKGFLGITDIEGFFAADHIVESFKDAVVEEVVLVDSLIPVIFSRGVVKIQHIEPA